MIDDRTSALMLAELRQAERRLNEAADLMIDADDGANGWARQAATFRRAAESVERVIAEVVK